MNKESPNADAPVPPAGTEQALSEALDQASKDAEAGGIEHVDTVGERSPST